MEERMRSENGDKWLAMESGPGIRAVLTFLLLFVAAFVSVHWVDNSISGLTLKDFLNFKAQNQSGEYGSPTSDLKTLGNQSECSMLNQTKQGCPTEVSSAMKWKTGSSCPDYFKWIHEDLRPWKVTGITREMVERAKSRANFRLVIVNGTVYIVKYRKAFQTRDLFTWWGILQLLRKYPGRLPDLDLMFSCADKPRIRSSDYQDLNINIAPPPLFQYCGNAWSSAIVFPDWSFWGWPEIKIKPWEILLKEFRKSNEMKKWIQREPHAFWKGNPMTSKSRVNLMKCNPRNQQDWRVRAYAQDWKNESRQGFIHSDLTKQCNHRYSIYVEGRGWSVSQKYALACDSVTLFVEPEYYDFITRSLMPMYHYWPIRRNHICRAIKFAVDWGNNHKQEAQAIGRVASNFIQKELKMDYVYDYMFNLLNEYAKLLKYKPTVPEHAIELSSERLACTADGVVKKFMADSMVKGPANTSPCTMPPQFDPPAMQAFLKEKEDTLKLVEEMEQRP